MNLNVCEVYTAIQGEGRFAGIPHILLRTTGCPLRCSFGSSICDSWYTSWSPEKGTITVKEIEEIYKNNRQIKYTMITGGEPFINPFLPTLIGIAKKYGHFVTIETSGVFSVSTNADFISLSPKLSSSIPKRVGTYVLQNNKSVKISQNAIKKHEELIKKYDSLKELIHSHPDYQIKPVITLEHFHRDIDEVNLIVNEIEANKEKVYLMPAGSNEEELQKVRVKLIEYCIESGYNYTDRLHIVAYGNKRGV